MNLLQIKEFSLSTAIEYERPVPFREAKLHSVAESIVAGRCGAYLNPADIALAKENELFTYSMSVPLFNGAASLNVNAKGLEFSFKQGRNKDHLDLMVDLTLAGFESAKAGAVKRSNIAFNAHAVFNSPEEYAAHMKRYTELSPVVCSGGLVAVLKIPDIQDAELRYASEKSLNYKNGLFFAISATCGCDVTLELYNVLAKQFYVATVLEGIQAKLEGQE